MDASGFYVLIRTKIPRRNHGNKGARIFALGGVLHVALLGEEHGIDIPFCKGRIAIQTYMHAFAL